MHFLIYLVQEYLFDLFNYCQSSFLFRTYSIPIRFLDKCFWFSHRLYMFLWIFIRGGFTLLHLFNVFHQFWDLLFRRLWRVPIEFFGAVDVSRSYVPDIASVFHAFFVHFLLILLIFMGGYVFVIELHTRDRLFFSNQIPLRLLRVCRWRIWLVTYTWNGQSEFPWT